MGQVGPRGASGKGSVRKCRVLGCVQQAWYRSLRWPQGGCCTAAHTAGSRRLQPRACLPISPSLPSSIYTGEASTPAKPDKKGGKHGIKKGGGSGGWLAGSLQPVPRDVAIVGLVLVFLGMRWAAGCVYWVFRRHRGEGNVGQCELPSVQCVHAESQALKSRPTTALLRCIGNG